jgi:pyridoxal phosphate enzyme (YggS family)
MPIHPEAYRQISQTCDSHGAVLVAVSKTKPVEDIKALYELGHRDFGENYVQELTEKQPQFPEDLRWHFIGHLQSNKVKFIAPFVHMIHGVDSVKLLKEINKQGARFGRRIRCLLQLHVAREETKFGLDEGELWTLLDELKQEPLLHVELCGVMAMASFTDNQDQVRNEFRAVRKVFDEAKHRYFMDDGRFSVISMGMSGDYRMALEEGSNMVRVGSLIFGER